MLLISNIHLSFRKFQPTQESEVAFSKNKKRLFSLLITKLESLSCVEPMKDPSNGMIAEKDLENAGVLARTFSSSFTERPHFKVNSATSYKKVSIDSIEITPSSVYHILY